MIMIRYFTVSFLALSCLQLRAFAALDGHCPPLGPVLPAPGHPSTDPAVKSSITEAKQILNKLTSSFNASAIAVGVKSIHESELLMEYAYTPPTVDPRGVKKVDADTVFRVGSLSKVFPALSILLLKGVSWDDPVTKYVPELRRLNKEARAQTPIWTVDWDEITLGALASHLSGIGADLVADLVPFGNYTPFGVPPLIKSEELGCAGALGLPPCNESVFFKRFGERAPVFLPFSPNPVYSNIGYSLLGIVVERVTGAPLAEFLQKHIWDPTGMKHTFSSKPEDSLGIISLDDPWWNYSAGFEAPSGGYYSSINDLHLFGDAILKHELLSPVQTRKWLKPATSTSSSGFLIGRPWEIFRAQNVTKDGRLIELYTKEGDIGTYHAMFALIPDYDLVVTTLTDGPDGSQELVDLILSNIVQTLLPGIEEAGKNENQISYAGTYVDKATNSSITLALDDSPGFAITHWTVCGDDIIALGPLTETPQMPPPPGLVRWRLYPTTIATETQSSWRALADIGTAKQIAEEDAKFVWAMNSCQAWESIDRLTYMLQSQDLFVFTVTPEECGVVATEVQLVMYEVALKRET